MKKENKKNNCIKNIFGYIFLVSCPFLIMIICNVFFEIYNKDILGGMTFVILPSYIILYVFFFFLQFCFNSLKKANYVLIVFFYIFILMNQIKIFYMQEPIYLSDIALLGGMGDVFPMMSGNWINFFSNNIGTILAHLIISVIFYIIISKIDEKKYNLKRNYLELAIFIIFLLLSLPLKTTTNFMKRMYGNVNAYSYIVNKIEYSYYYGLIGALYGNMLENRIFIPDNYNEDKVSDIINNYEYDNALNKKNPNIILIFSESFFDITKVKNDITYSYDILEDYHNLSKKYKLIQMLSRTYGGMSSNVEFELMTSFNLSYYSNSYIPYLNLIDKNFAKKENLLTILKNNGYKNYYFYSTADSLYNVGNVSDYLGFNKYNKKNVIKKGYYISDEYVMDTIIDLIEREENNVFYLAETMQSHMPYYKDKYDNYNVKIEKSSLSFTDEETVLSYSEGIHDASVELKRLSKYLENSDEETVVIFIGDHLPYLSNKNGENIIDKLPYFNTPNDEINLYRKYNTEALILSNFDIEFDKTEYLSPDLLIPYVLNALNIPMTPYYNYLVSESKNVLSCYNKYVYVDNQGKIGYTSLMSDDILSEYKLRESLQYKLYYKK